MATNRLLAWNFETPNAAAFTQPLVQGIEAGYRDRQQGVDNARQNRLLEMQQGQADLQRQRFGMDQQRFQREQERAKVMDPLEVDRVRASIAQTQAQTAAANAQRSQLRMQTPEYRAQIAGKYGLQPNTSEYNQFVLNGQFTPPDPIKDLIRGVIPQVQPQQGQPRVQLQSMPGGGEGQPQMIPAQVGQTPPAPQQAPVPMVDTPIGRIPETQAKAMGFALALQGKGDAGKMLAGEPGLGKTAMNDVDSKIVDGVSLLARMDGIARAYKPEYQTIGTRLGMTTAGWMAKIDPSKVDPQTAQQLSEFSTYRRRAAENVNATIKEITGAAMSIPEAQRILSQVPNAGTGILDGDDPITFKAKLDDVMKQTRLAVARNAYLKKNNPQLLSQLAARKMEGIDGVLPLDQMHGLMNERKNQIYQELKQRSPNASPAQLAPFVGQRLKQEFGI